MGLTPSPATQPSTRLEEWKALTAPDGGAWPATRYATFLARQPAWPLQKRIEWRYEHALLAEPDEQIRRRLCQAFPISRGDLLGLCAPYLTNLPAQARRLWRDLSMNAGEQQQFLTAFSRYLAADDDIARYARLERIGPYAAARQQALRLPETFQPILFARLANHFGRADADTLFQNLSNHDDEGLLYYRVKYLRLHDRLDEAVSLWQEADRQRSNTATAPKLPSPETAEWQDERASLVRALLRSEAPDVVQNAAALLHIPDSEQSADTQLLSGYVALICQHAPLQAVPHFQALIAEKDLNRRAAGLYWMGRSSEARHSAYAATFYAKAASFPTSFYGQLALARHLHTPFLTSLVRNRAFLQALQKQLAALPPIPETTTSPRPDLADAARTLQKEGDLINATMFLTYLQAHMQGNLAAQPAIARLALSLRLPKAAILAARRLAREGKTLYPAGYPELDTIPPSSLPDGLLPALTRQESSMDDFATSPRRAYGLTQLLLPTAAQLARRHKLPYRLGSPLTLMDANVNLSLGSLYLEDLLSRYGHVLPYALAAYNAGPARSQQWQAQMHTPSSPHLEDEDVLLRWLLLLPYKETRFYIEHIQTDMSLYATKAP